MNISDIQKDTLHHCSLIKGSSESFTILEKIIEKIFNITFVGNPDLLSIKIDSFNVVNARAVVDFASKASIISSQPKIILLYFSTITVESQNILLKTLEEPSKNTYIFILTPNVNILLPTVLSRCMLLALPAEEASFKNENDFITANLQQRFKIIEKINKLKDGGDKKAKFLEILNDIEIYLNKNKSNKNWDMSVQAVLQAKKHMHSKGAMSKMLMESVAIVL